MLSVFLQTVNLLSKIISRFHEGKATPSRKSCKSHQGFAKGRLEKNILKIAQA